MAVKDNTVSCSGPINLDCCFYICAPAGLLAKAAKALGTFFPCCENEDIISITVLHREPFLNTPVDGRGGLWRRVRLGSLSRVMMYLLRKP